tara:strand:- start:384 stop:515 length:132 start_codon:yes stop_codon:yes gene_type:complete
MQSRESIERHLEELYIIKPSKTLKVKGVLESVILFWENKLKTM